MLTDEEKEFLRGRRQLINQSQAQSKAEYAAARAKAIARWESNGGVYQAHPDIPEKELREAVEGISFILHTRAHKYVFTHAQTHTGIECRLSLLETAVGDFRKFILGFNGLQRASINYAGLMDLMAEFDSIAGSLDQRVFNTFDKLNLPSTAARDLSQQVDDQRKKRRAEATAAEDVVPPSLGGGCQCRKSEGRKIPLCLARCPCERAGKSCGSHCLCGDDCNNQH